MFNYEPSGQQSNETDIRKKSMSEILAGFSKNKKEKPQSKKVNEAEIVVGKGWALTRKNSGAVQIPPNDAVDVSLGNSRPKRPDKIITGSE